MLYPGKFTSPAIFTVFVVTSGVLIDGTWEIHPVEITDNPQPFELTVDRKPDRVAFDPFYRIFRWRPDLKKTPELKTVMTLNEVHQSDRALEKLQALLPELADSVAAKLLLGEINLNLNRFDGCSSGVPMGYRSGQSPGYGDVSAGSSQCHD